MNYELRWFEETAWAAVVAALTYIVTVAAAGMPADNWKAWVIAGVAGAGRAAMAAIGKRIPSVAPPSDSARPNS